MLVSITDMSEEYVDHFEWGLLTRLQLVEETPAVERMNLLYVAKDDAALASQWLYDVIATHFRYIVVDDEA